MDTIKLSDEQQFFVDKALEGHNILVDACIGSGKTTAIQMLCDKLPLRKKILYLTYNRLLKNDAQSKIHNSNVKVQNYHGIAASYLYRMGIKAGVSDFITRFNELKPHIDHYDVLIIDEYQDIEFEFCELLEHIKSYNPHMQIVAVGDMQQKIYDRTRLNVSEFIDQFLGEHLNIEFTQCFRLSADIAGKLGRIWQKTIVGVNPNCTVEEMTIEQVTDFLATQSTQDILCLGAKTGDLSKTLNTLEHAYPLRFNKNTVYATISDNDSWGTTTPTKETAIFTTFDRSKGLERKICVIFDYTESYWQSRISKPKQSYEILRNLFCVAASRGKSQIIFVNSGEALVSEATLSTRVEDNNKFEDVDISSMFDFKFHEDTELCYSLLKATPITVEDHSIIEVRNKDGMIDLSPCIGIYQEAMYFEGYDIDKDINLYLNLHSNKKYLWTKKEKEASLEQKILFYTSLETDHDRYRTQVELPLVDPIAANQISDRLSTRLKRTEKVQEFCFIDFSDEKDGYKLFVATGFADVVKDGIVYELKFVSELKHEHYLQCACYVVALGLEKGILWNTRDNTMYEISVPDKKKFLDAVTTAITKHRITTYYEPSVVISKPSIPRPTPKITKSKAKIDISKYVVGSKVHHKSFGNGIITKMISAGPNTHVIEVKFERVGYRKLMLEIVLNAKTFSLVSE